VQWRISTALDIWIALRVWALVCSGRMVLVSRLQSPLQLIFETLCMGIMLAAVDFWTIENSNDLCI
jgi:hypothetical protein